MNPTATRPPHVASTNCYQSGCRTAECRLAHKIAMSRYRAARERRGGKVTERGIVGGRLAVPVDEVSVMVNDLYRVLTRRKVAALAQVNEKTLYELSLSKRRYVFPSTAKRISEVWSDYCAPADTSSRWPTEPLRRALVARWGGVKSAPLSVADRRYLYRSETLEDARAERLCKEADVFPESVWPDWFGLEEVG